MGFVSKITVGRSVIGNTVTAVAALLVVALWIAAYYRTTENFRNKQLAVAMNAANIAETFQQSLNDTVGQVDLVLKILRDLQGKHGIKASWDDLIDPTYLTNPVVTQFAAVAADGYTIASTIPSNQWRNLNFKDREHFRAHLDISRDELFISKPMIGRGSGHVSLQLTRRLTSPDGSFGGVVLASIDPNKLVRAYQALSLGAGSGIALVGNDDIILAGAGIFSERLGLSLTDPKTSKTSVDGMLAGARKGYVVERHESKDASRIVISRKVRDYPLKAVVAVGDDINLAFWERLESSYFLFAMLGSILVLTASVSLLHYQKQAQQNMTQRRQSC
jgi:hypothetical protein